MSVACYLGGARSGKSRLAEAKAAALAEARGLEKLYLGSAQPLDDEMTQRIAHHQASRQQAGWTTIEEPLALASRLAQHQQTQPVMLIDCLTLWLTNLLMLEDEARFLAEREAFLVQLSQMQSPVILVSNEVGQGIVPLGALSRRFVDEAGRLHQAVAALAGEVYFVAAGLPLKLK
jgi:adenosylcobinamide kinase/adenosylcobinamide-phosphate guanylyltransferase